LVRHLRDEERLRISENSVLRGERKKLYSEEFRNLWPSSDIRRILSLRKTAAVVTLSGYRSRGPGFDFRSYQIV
jgi:hypothetical protein